METEIRKDYYAFLLRLWRVGEIGSWRATLENPHNGKTYGFADLNKLFSFLHEQIGNSDDSTQVVNKPEE